MEFLSPLNRAAFVLWAAVVGTGEAPGLLQLLRLAMKRRPHIGARWRATVAGRLAGLHSFAVSRGKTSSRRALQTAKGVVE